MCSQHHQPISECEPWDRHGHSVRFREDDWQATEATASTAELYTTTELIAHGMEVMLGYLRCDRGRCATEGAPVTVTFGDLTGKTLGEWIAEAAKQVRRQHPHHEPVTIGATPSQVVPAAPEPLQRARARTRPGAAVFMEPGSEPHITPVPEVPVRSKKGRVRA
jgi:hypothetical protein